MIKNKRSGYVLLLTMIILSSIFLLAITIIRKTQIAQGTVTAMHSKHKQFKYLMNAITLIKDLLIVKDEQGSKEKSEGEKKKSLQEMIYFFNFYWEYGNRWLNYTLYNQKYDIDAKISFYITIEDGKFPLKKIFKEYVEEQNKEKKNDDASGEVISQDGEKPKEEKRAEENKKDTISQDKRNGEEGENKESTIAQKNNFLKEMKIIFEKLELSEKNSIKKLFQLKEKGANDKKSFLWTIIEKYAKKSKISPCSLEMLFDKNIFANKDFLYNIKSSNSEQEKKKSALYDLISVDNNTINPLFISPVLLEAVIGKEVPLSNEVRSKIINDGKKYVEKNDKNIRIEDFWKQVIEKNIDAPYPREIFDNREMQKMVQKNVNYPECISTIVKIEILDRSLFALVTFEKNKRYDKDNEEYHNQSREYLIKSICILSM